MTNDSSVQGAETIKSSDPYFLHSSDHPGIVLVTKLLNRDNYSTWSHSMGIALSAKNKSGFVDGSIEKPSKTDEKNSTLEKVQ